MREIHPSPAAGIVPAFKLRPDSDGGISFPRTEAASSAELRENFRTLNEVLDELYFKPAFYPGDGTLLNGALFDASVINAAASVEFPAAGVPGWLNERVRRSRWQNAQIRLTLSYTATVGSTNNFWLSFAIREHGAGTVHPAANLIAVGVAIPGPAIAKTELSFVYVSPGVAINGALRGLTFGLARDKTNAGDTNVNSLHVLSAEWEILPL